MRMMTKLICAAFLLSLAMPALVVAQDEEASAYLASVWVVHPREGHFGEFMTAAAEHIAFRKAQGDSRSWEGYQPVMGDDIGKVVFRYCCFEWADEDAYLATADDKGLGAHWNENVDPHVAHYEHYFSAVDFDNSHWNDDAGEASTLFGVTEWYVAPGKSGDFNDMKEKMSTMAKEQGWASEETNWSWYTRIGGKPVEAIVPAGKDFLRVRGGADGRRGGGRDVREVQQVEHGFQVHRLAEGA